MNSDNPDPFPGGKTLLEPPLGGGGGRNSGKYT